MKMRIGWTKDQSLISVQVYTQKMAGRPFPAWTGLVDIMENGKISWNTKDAIAFRKSVIKQLKEEKMK